MEWGSYDPVVLAAISLGKMVSLDRLVANIDASDRYLPPHAVVAPSVGRLVGARLVESDRGSYRLTPFARSLLDGVRGGTISRVRDVRMRLLQLAPASQVDVLDQEDWDAAVARYVARHSCRSTKGPQR